MDPKGLMMIGAVLLGGFFGLSALKGVKGELPLPTGAQSLTGMPLTKDSMTRAAGAPADYLVTRTWGVIVEGPVANHDRSSGVFIADALRDWRPADDAEVVARVQMLREQDDCIMPPPAEGARVVNLLVEHPSSKSGLYSFSQDDLLDSVDTWFSRIRHQDMPQVPGPEASHEFRVHDIAVTETSAPVHLVLQTYVAGNVLYNFHLAPGAVVSGVSMLGGDANAVANLADGVPVAVMTGRALRDCGVPMADALRGEAGIEAQIRDRKLTSEEDIAAARAALAARVEAHDTWFRAQFGVRPLEGRIGYSFAEVTLVGPVPESPKAAPEYRPLTGASVIAQAQEFFKVEGLHDWPQAYRDEVVRIGTELAGGDPLVVVRPRHMLMEF